MVSEKFAASGIGESIRPGMNIAVGVGSRGITNLKDIARATVDLLLNAGARPFVLPAMGSHGGATAVGQVKVLSDFGVTATSMGVPIQGDMEVRRIGCTPEGVDVFFSAAALEADAVVVLNRVKPHTDFRGTIGSGIQKMLTIGFGKQEGAEAAHRAAAHVGHEAVIRSFAKVILEMVPVLCGVAVLEDQRHQTAAIEILRPDCLGADEERLFKQAEALLARLPFEDIDLLIVDEIGKEFSGAGMDTNVIGRNIAGYSTLLSEKSAFTPRVGRIIVRDLSTMTNGNGAGIGMADFTTSRAVRSLNGPITYLNAMTAMSLQCAKIPIHFETDREVISHALSSLASTHPEDLRVVQIANTLNLERFFASRALLADVSDRKDVRVVGSFTEMNFDGNDNLRSV